VESSANPLNLSMDAPKWVTARFAATMSTSAPAPVPIWWLAKHGLTNFEQDASVDSDGQFNWEEYIAAGTDPTNPASFFHTRVGQGSLLLSWPSATGRVYDVQQTLAVEPGAWSAVPTWTNLSATPPMNSVVHPTSAMTNAARFYRTVGRMADD